jgi:hypothetical protein
VWGTHTQTFPTPFWLLNNYQTKQDLNYRINGGRRAVNFLLRAPPQLREALIANDQLALQMRAGAAFKARVFF